MSPSLSNRRLASTIAATKTEALCDALGQVAIGQLRVFGTRALGNFIVEGIEEFV
jgi:hypothetical protein